MGAKIQYPYAFDEGNNLVFIGNVKIQNRHDHSYHCPNCGGEMLPRLGNHNERCFAHAGNQKCSGESYLHRAAKILLAKRFNERSKPFKIGLSSARPCFKLATCHEGSDNCHLLPEYKEFDLHEFYDLPAEVEVDILEPDGETHFTPDAMLRSSNPQRQDIFIEIYYKHKITQEKIRSGHKIIEIRVRKLDDIKKLEELECFKESEDIVFYNFEPRKVKPKQIVDGMIQYWCEYGYWKKESDLPPCRQSRETKRRNSHLRRLSLFKSGKFFNEGILEEERGTHRTSAIMDITYESKNDLSNLVLLGVMARCDIRARVCTLCDHCITYENTYAGSKNTWCELVKNGSTRKETFNPFKGNYCPHFEWTKFLDLEQTIDSFCKEDETYSIWLNSGIS